MLDRRPFPSPCVSICVMDPATGWCEGCFRTLPEIAAWGGLSSAERCAVLALLPARRQAAARADAPSEQAQ
jgi:predicted Fe-S protein YdhL (DUF1289 family)